jgi:replication-associated recombination protein RarA
MSQVSRRTVRGYDFYELLSALQKDIRRGREYEALFWAAELETFNATALWNRLRIIASEDVGIASPFVPVIVDTLHRQYLEFKKNRNDAWRLFLANAVLLLARCTKSRMVDDLVNVVYTEILQDDKRPEIPNYALDMHTARGRAMGRGIEYFISEGSKLVNENGKLLNLYKERAAELLLRHGGPKNESLQSPSSVKKTFGLEDFV